ncbi:MULTISPECIES: type VI secretion system protein TssL, long form [Bradyrhizobium]|jgi:type VI secretion system protein ImpK|uniref:Type IV secretion protein DotU n=3 Tax=Nitrobacteraceae TaxID=41294 RepID=A0A1X3GCJ1_9BRAD|nr:MULTISPECIES: type VI secretion system protein TssL, long form [Bradyrhizobium]MCK1431308.1 type VI secretion system protein TssL [Bradyrhizobium sp. 87]MCK1656993.1 type VI secretion system protein TssL [Bradyrhizobium sp. 151]MCK1701269.1 type VI secretion system protein TssL [Bradyrhizobium sp. 146]MBM7483497.1 type VI secretion system protein ImpK [Bradyrhizobium canariense]MCK1290957.1 type VI secretion system protein TssL [Bradyrhizobium sp. 30]
MSDKDKPVNPFGRGERTIIRPNPGGKLPPAPISQPPPGGGPAARPAYSPSPVPSPGTPAPPPSFSPVPQGSNYASAPASHPAEEWISTPAQGQVPQPLMPPGPPLRVDDLVAPNANPVMRAAGPLLQLLGRLRVALMRASFASLMEQVADAIKFFEKDIRSAGISEHQANTAKYILCATADDIVQHIPTEERHVWTQYSMLSRFFGERVGGVRFFEILDHLKVDPLVNYPVLELQHACLALGFQGIHRTSGGGLANLQLIQRNLYELLRRVRPKTMSDLSPNWRGQALAGRRQRLRVPVWLVAAVVAALLTGSYFVLRTLLAGRAENAAEVALALHPAGPIELKRQVVAPPPPPPPPPPPDRITQLQRIRNALAKENTACAMTADQTPSFIVIRVCDLALFASGQATILDGFKPIALRVAATLDKEPGRIRVVGHTDSSPIRTVRFPTNFELSVERAKAVAAALKPGLNDGSRVDVEGKGADAPIASNTTPEGRAKNRRVEIFIERSE